jgi:hypothetical protein
MLDLVVFENDKPYAINEFHEGRFDYIELASDVAEALPPPTPCCAGPTARLPPATDRR